MGNSFNFNASNLKTIFEKRDINAILVCDLYFLTFYAFEGDHHAIEEILYNIKPRELQHEIKKVQSLHSIGLSIVETEFDLNRQNSIFLLPKNKIKRFLVKFFCK